MTLRKLHIETKFKLSNIYIELFYEQDIDSLFLFLENVSCCGYIGKERKL